MATVRMKRGDKYADIFDSPETIAQAKSEGYELVTDSKKTEPAKTENEDADKKPRVGRPAKQ